MANVPAPERKEIATTRDGRDITRPWVNALMPLTTEDTVLVERGGGDYRLYQEVLRDDHVKAAVEQRRRAVIARPWEVRPGGKRAIDKAAADFLKENIDAIGWDTVCDKMLAGVFYGFSVAEALWAPDGRYWRLDQLRVRNRRRFAFDAEANLLLLTVQKPLGEVMPERKFWTFSAGADHDDAPYGLGLGHWLYWPVWFKRYGHRFWAVYLEKYGTPAAKGTYPASATEQEQAALLESLRALRQDSAVVVPEGMVIELIEATRSGTADYAAFIEAMNRAILVAAIGQTATTQGTPGKLGSDQQQGEVRMDIVRADADLLSASFNASIARWLTEWNFPGAKVPGVWRVIDEPEDLKLRSDRDINIYRMGYKPTQAYVQETYGGEWTDVPAPAVPAGGTQPPGSPGATAAPGGAEFAEGDGGDPTPVTPMADRMATEAEPAWTEILAHVRQLVESANSLPELRDALLAAYSSLPGERLTEVMAMGFAAADLAGRFDVSRDA